MASSLIIDIDTTDEVSIDRQVARFPICASDSLVASAIGASRPSTAVANVAGALVSLLAPTNDTATDELAGARGARLYADAAAELFRLGLLALGAPPKVAERHALGDALLYACGNIHTTSCPGDAPCFGPKRDRNRPGCSSCSRLRLRNCTRKRAHGNVLIFE